MRKLILIFSCCVSMVLLIRCGSLMIDQGKEIKDLEKYKAMYAKEKFINAKLKSTEPIKHEYVDGHTILTIDVSAYEFNELVVVTELQKYILTDGEVD